MRRPSDLKGWTLALPFVVLAAACGGQGGGAGGESVLTRADTMQDRSADAPTLQAQVSGTEVLLQAVSPVDERVVWVSGHGGTFARTLDGGDTWTAGVVPGADTLQFRDVHALSADVAWLLAAGPADMSRIYRTDDGGANWTLQWTNPEPDGFYDCLDFWSAERGAVYGDAVEGNLRVLRTSDGGANWERLGPGAVPDGQLGEGGFAASGTCLVAGKDGRGWISTGNAPIGRVLTTQDYGASWVPYDSPIPGAAGAGLFSISFRDSLNGVIFGGDLRPEPMVAPRVAVSSDGGASWAITGEPAIGGAIFGGQWVPGTDPPVMVAVAPTGAEYSTDGGQSWEALDSESYWGLGFASPDAGWLVGPGGRITKVGF